MPLRRLVAAGLHRLQRPVDRIYAARHPGVLARGVIDALAPVVRALPANDKWSLGVHAPYWATAARLGADTAPAHRPRRIFLFCAYRGQFTLDLSLAALLAWRGHAVTLGYLAKLRSPVKPPLADHHSASAYLADALGRVEKASDGRIRAVDLAPFEAPDAPIDEAFLRRQVHSDVIMRLLKETPDPQVAEDAEAMAYFETLGRRAQRIAHGFLASRANAFDLCIVPNGTTFESAHVCAVARRLGLEINTLEKFAFRGIRVLNHGDDFRAFNDLESVWRRRRELGFTEPGFKTAAARRAAALMDERRRASKATWAWTLQQAPDQGADAALREAGVDTARPFALVCTNVPYDAGYDRLTRIFPSMRAWLIETVRALLADGALQVVVRCHPGEAAHYGGRERSHENLAAAGFAPGGRLVVIPGERRTNTYGLMERCQFGVVFSSTTGLEMAMMGKRVLTGADVYYGRRGFTEDAEDRAGYLAALRALAAAVPPAPLGADQIDDARLFHFLLHFVMQWPYPYDKPGDVRDRPPHLLVRSAEMARYLPTLDALALPRAEFEQRIGEFLSTARCAHLPALDRMDLAA